MTPTFWWRSLTTRVTMFTLLTFVSSIWLLAFCISQMLESDMQKVMGEQQFATVSLMAADIDHALIERRAALTALAKHVAEGDIKNTAALQVFLENHLQLVIGSMFNGGVFITDVKGTAIADFPKVPGRVGTNYMDRESISVPLREARTVIGKPNLGKTLKAPIFSIVVPIVDGKGVVTGSVAGTVNLGLPSFLDTIASTAYGRGGAYLLVASQYRLVITGTDKQRVMTTLPPAGKFPTLDRFLEGFNGSSVYTNPLGVEVLVSGTAIPVAGWRAVATLPTAEAFAPIHQMQRHIIEVTALLTLFAGGLTWWWLKRQVAPVVAAATALAIQSQMPVSDLVVQHLPVGSQDEIGSLLAAFNHLMERLQHREEALLESERYKLAILNSVGFEVVVLDHQGIIRAVNKPWQQVATQNSEDGTPARCTGVGSDYLAVCQAAADDSVEGVQIILQGIRSVLDGSAVSFSADYPCHSPTVQRWFNITVLPMAMGAGMGVVISHTDISVRKFAELALSHNEERFRHFFEKNSAVQLLIEPASGRILNANASAARFYGYTREQLIGMPISSINTLPPKQIDEERKRALQEARNYFQFQHRLASGALRDVEVHSSPIETNGGQYLLSIVHDVTERRVVEQKLQATLAEQKAILTSDIAGIVKISDGRFDWMNGSFAAMMGYAIDEMEGQPTHIIFVGEEAYARFMGAAYPTLQRGQIFRTEGEYVRKDGTRGWCDISGELLAAGSTDSIWCCVDITEKKRTSLQLERVVMEQNALLNNDLIGIVTTRDRVIIWANAAYEKMMGYESGELNGVPTQQNFFNPEDYHSLGDAAYAELSEGKVYSTQTRHVRKDGAVIWVEISGEYVHNGSGDAMWCFVDVTQRKIAQDRVHQLAFHDALTSLPNRRLLMDRLGQTMASSKRNGRYAAMLFLDLDNFKPLNDQFGHEAGDVLLIEVAKRLLACVREVDTVARFGGDEFVVMLSELDADRAVSQVQAGVIAEKMRATLAEPYGVLVNPGTDAETRIEHHCTVSIGVALFFSHVRSENEVLHHADQAMYQAKQDGRNVVRFYES